jgi:invasion protein IalB
MTVSRRVPLALGVPFALLALAWPALAQETRPQPARPGAASTPTGANPAGGKPAAAPTRPNAAGATTGSGAAGRAAGAATGATAGAGAAAGRPGGHQALLLGTFNDWEAYATTAGRAKICYALSRPKERLPKDLNRDPAYIFVSVRPTENVRNEVAVVLGFAAKDGSDAKAAVGASGFDFVTKDQNAWVKNAAQEDQVVQTLSRGGSLTLRATSRRGNDLTDRYSLQGFAPAMERARKECQG